MEWISFAYVPADLAKKCFWQETYRGEIDRFSGFVRTARAGIEFMKKTCFARG